MSVVFKKYKGGGGGGGGGGSFCPTTLKMKGAFALLPHIEEGACVLPFKKGGLCWGGFCQGAFVCSPPYSPLTQGRLSTVKVKS